MGFHELFHKRLFSLSPANISCSRSPFFSDADCLSPDSILRSLEGDQVVPSSQRRHAYGRETKPLPPLPDPEELMADEAADNEVEFFSSDRRRLLPKSCPKAVCRDGNRGQVNYAYKERLLRTGSTDTGSVAFSWPPREDRSAVKGGGNWALAPHKEDQDGLWSTLDDRSPQRFPTPADKPRVPPRIPIQPKPNTEDKPPKIPPRVPLVPPCPPRTPSPKSLPIYINGVMPATQSFAANPQYVSRARQQSERTPPAAHFSPSIIPILKDGRQASATHYILLPPRRPAHSDRRERLFSEPARVGNSSIWQNR